MKLWLFIINTIFAYLSTEYREYEEVTEDLNSVKFYNNFKLNLDYFDDNPNQYIKTCDQIFFGLFRYGNISTYMQYDGYGTLGINFDLYIVPEFYKTNINDKFNFT